ncbi:MAG: XdhC family protein [Candidatus Omnitrophica bacterium]|nr:XdhC family protein [Candidatus Omnitrophota bacterium]
MTSLFGRAQELLDENRTAALATVVETKGSSPRKPGARMIVYPDGSIEGTVGGGGLEKRVIEESLALMKKGESRLLHISLHDQAPGASEGMCGGEMRVFIESIGGAPRLLILGAGHVARTLARMAVELDLNVMVYDNREEYADDKYFPSQVRVIHGPFENAMERLEPAPRDSIVIMTYNHEWDQSLLKDALETSAGYVGMIGSQTKCKQIRDNLTKLGIPGERLRQAHAPIGLPIGGHAPAEISISILGEMIREYYNKDQSKTGNQDSIE